MKNRELAHIALTLAKECLEGFEYLSVAEYAEDSELDLTDEEMDSIFDMVITAKPVISVG